MDGGTAFRVGVRAVSFAVGAITLCTMSGIALADPSLPDASTPVDTVTDAAGSAAGTVSDTADTATGAADAAVDTATSAASSAPSTASSTASSAASAAAGAAPTSQGATGSANGAAGGSDSASQGGAVSPGPSAPSDSGESSASTDTPPNTGAASGSAEQRGDERKGGPGKARQKRLARTGPEQQPAGDHRSAHRGRRTDMDDDRRQQGDPFDDLAELVESGQLIGDTATVSVVADPGGVDDPPLIDGLPITGLEVAVLAATGLALVAVGMALMASARGRARARSRLL